MKLQRWFGFSGYPEIKRVAWEVTADTRPGHFAGSALCASVQIGEWSGVFCFPPGHKNVGDLEKVVQLAKTGIEWHRRVKNNG